MMECPSCLGYGFRFAKTYWEIWERVKHDRSVKACRNCNGKGVVMGKESFCSVSYFEGQSDACEMFAKQFEKYRQAAKNPDAEEFCAKTIEWLNAMRDRFRAEAKLHKLG